MNTLDLVAKTADMIKQKLSGEGSGHDWWHIYRVWQTAKTIAAGENANLEIVELGALLHDIADHKFHGGDKEIGGKEARKWLSEIGADAQIIDQVVHIVDNVSFKGGAENKMQSIEGKIVQDADRIDAMGAIGIARCFVYGGYTGQPIHDPEVELRAGVGTDINHFYEKLLLLKDLMNTETGKKLAQARHEFMESYLRQFFAEWEGVK